MPLVSIALDCNAALLALNDKIDSILKVSGDWAELRDDGITSSYNSLYTLSRHFAQSVREEHASICVE